MQIPQVCVGIKGRVFPCLIKDVKQSNIEIIQIPSQIKFQKLENKDQDQILWFEASLQIETPTKYLKMKIRIDGKEWDIPMRIFGEREFFLVFILQSNVHEGWNVRAMKGFYPDESGLKGPMLRKKLGLLGPGLRNHAFLHHIGDEEELAKMPESYRYKPLEQIWHSRGFPITWLIDQNVAGSYRDYFVKWHQQFRDMVGYLPPSYHALNYMNYNTQKTLEETTALLHEVRIAWDRAFAENPENAHPIYTRFCGIDQWVGSVGTNWINAAEAEGLEGIWGMGWDHQSCDSSMFHRGAPWNAYKPSKSQFRCVKPANQKRSIWAFQWTDRDLVNSLPLSPLGSVCFSTDLDDIRTQKILYLERSPTYFWKLLQEYRQAMERQDFAHFVYIIHQEDHEAHFKDDNEFMDIFTGELKMAIDRGEKITIATLEEVTGWLNLRYTPEENNWQYLELHDPLKVETRAQIQKKYFHTVGRLYDFEEEEKIEQKLNEVYPADKILPTTTAYFDENYLWLTQYPRHLPNQFYDYTDSKNLATPENGELKMVEIPEISEIKEEFTEKGYNLQFVSKNAVKILPWTIWPFSYLNTPSGWKESSIFKKGPESVVFLLKIKEGQNTFML